MRINPLTSLAKSPKTNQYIDWALKEKTAIKDSKETKATYYSKMQKHFPTLFLLWLNGFQCMFLAHSKTMPDDRKPSLIFSNIYSCAIGVAGGIVLQKPIDKIKDKLVQRAEVLYKDDKVLHNGIKTAVPAIITTFLFEYVGPVIATPLSSQSTKLLVKKGILHFDDKKGETADKK